MRAAHCIALSLLVACTTAGPRGEGPSASRAAEPVLQAERERFAAMTAPDLVALDTLLGDDLVYTHTTGVAQTKSEFLAAVRSRAIEYLGITPRDVHVLYLADSAVAVTGRGRMRVRSSSAALEFDIRFVDVLVRRANRWVCVRWQSTRIGP